MALEMSETVRGVVIGYIMQLVAWCVHGCFGC